MNRKKIIVKVLIGAALTFGFWTFFKMRLEKINTLSQIDNNQRNYKQHKKKLQKNQSKMGYSKSKKRQPSQQNPH